MSMDVIGAEKQITTTKPLLLKPGKLTAEEELERRSQEADTTAFFTGGDVTNRPVVGEEVNALEKVIKEKLAKGKLKVMPFPTDENFDDVDKPDSE
jgi:hypothetical protein